MTSGPRNCPEETLHRLRSTYGASDEALLVVSGAGEICLHTAAARELLQVDPTWEGDHQLEELEDLACLDPSPALVRSIRRTLEDHTLRTWSGTHQEGGSRSLQVDLIPLPTLSAPGTDSFLLCRFRLGDRLSASAQAEQLRRRTLEMALEELPTAVLLFDREGKVFHLNQRGRAMVGRKAWHILGEEHPFVICDLKGRPLPREEWPLLKALETGESCTNREVQLDFGEVQRIISMNIVAVREDGEISFFLVTGRDITERAQQDRRKDDFLSVASHELRGPLTPLSGLLQLARKRVESGYDLDLDLLVRAESQVTRLRRLIESLLDLSRIQTGKLPLRPEPTEMCDLVEQIMQPWMRGQQKSRISLELPADPCWAQADPDRVEQVVTNLVDNAIKHGPEGPIRVRVAAVDGMVELSVCDSGEGLPQDVIERVFSNALYVPRESRSTFGLGLGLFITRQIAESHGGSLTIGAVPDCNSKIIASFPAVPAS